MKRRENTAMVKNKRRNHDDGGSRLSSSISISLPILAKKYSLVLLISCYFTLASSFNLENRLPIVKYGSPNSYFGYSVAEHIETVSPTDTKKW